MEKKNIKKHIIYWVLLATIISVASPLNIGLKGEIISNIFIFSNYILIYYFLGLYVFPRYLKLRRFGLFAIWVFFCYLFYCSYYYLIGKLVLPLAGGKSYLVDEPLKEYLTYCSILFLFVLIAVSAWYLNVNSIKRIKWLNLKENNLTIRELDYLKGQFNSHLTFNFFNYCYSYIRQHSSIAAESIENFTDMLRYYLNNKNFKIPLEIELNYIQKYLALHCQLNENFSIDFNVQGNINNIYLVAGVLAAMVNNTIAISNGLKYKKNLKMYLEVRSERIEFTIKSEKRFHLLAQDINAFNFEMKKILELFYNQNSQFKLINNESYFCYLCLTESIIK